jgi:hypothetical protein
MKRGASAKHGADTQSSGGEEVRRTAVPMSAVTSATTRGAADVAAAHAARARSASERAQLAACVKTFPLLGVAADLRCASAGAVAPFGFVVSALGCLYIGRRAEVIGLLGRQVNVPPHVTAPSRGLSGFDATF